jgi:tetratricopeptide (TPR) repeat protein
VPEEPAPQATPPPLPADKPVSRDTPGAIAAMELALAYIEEVRDADRPLLDDMAERKQQLNTLALAAKQLDLANRLDPDAILEGSTDDGYYRFSGNELKAEALLLEGMTHQLYDLKRAIPALVRATELNPNSAQAFYVLGLTHAANMGKAKAVAAFEQAVALEPRNIAYRKELNRAQSLSGGEIAAYKATRAGEKMFDAGIKTANAGIMAWNIFAVLWNILTFPLRLVFGLFRILRLHPFA